MKPLFRFVCFLLFLLVTYSGTACNDEQPNDEAGDIIALERMAADIDDFIGTAECGGDDDCRALAFGSKPCGGPWSYKVFSTSYSDSSVLADMILQYNQFNDELNDRYGWGSDCMFVGPPTVECIKGRCGVSLSPNSTEF